MNDGETRNSLFDNYNNRNEVLFNAFYYFLEKHTKLMKESEVGLMYETHDYDDETFRSYRLKFRPSDEIRIGDFLIEFSF